MRKNIDNILKNKYVHMTLKNKPIRWLITFVIAVILPWIIFGVNPVTFTFPSTNGTLSRILSIAIISFLPILLSRWFEESDKYFKE